MLKNATSHRNDVLSVNARRDIAARLEPVANVGIIDNDGRQSRQHQRHEQSRPSGADMNKLEQTE